MGEETSQKFSMKAQDSLVGRIASSGVVLPLFDVIKEARNRADELAGGVAVREEHLLVYAGSPKDGGGVSGRIYEVSPGDWYALWTMPGDNKLNMYTLSPKGSALFKEGNMNCASVLLEGQGITIPDGEFSAGDGTLFASEAQRVAVEEITIEELRDHLVVAMDRWNDELRGLTYGKTADEIGALDAKSAAVLMERIETAGQVVKRLDIIQHIGAYRADLLANLDGATINGKQKTMIENMVERGDSGYNLAQEPGGAPDIHAVRSPSSTLGAVR